MRTSEFDYSLPQDAIAQVPTDVRTASRLMVLRRSSKQIEEAAFEALPFLLRPGDLLVLNDSKVIPARLRGQKHPGSSRIEILLLEPSKSRTWWVMLRPGKRVRPGTVILLPDQAGSVEALVREKSDDGRYLVEFQPGTDVLAFATSNGEMPLPPYIRRSAPLPVDRERYQTVYAAEPGSVAAPTAGLHFSEPMLESLGRSGIRTAFLTLHVGAGTFAPVKAEMVSAHRMHAERFTFGQEAAEIVNETKAGRGRVIAVGTTTLRALETVARSQDGRIAATTGETRLFIHPPASFHVADALLTNFHLPRSTLLMLVSAFANPGGTDGRDFVLRAYRQAIKSGFRFFSYGDAMLLL